MDTLLRTRTDEVLLEMLRENTSRYMLDSGGAYGRNWERNRSRDLENEPVSVVSFRFGEVELTHHVFGWLRERLTYDEDANRAMAVMTRFIRLSNRRDGVRDRGYVAGEWVETNGEAPNEMERRELFPEFFRAWKARQDEADRDECRVCDGSGDVEAEDDDARWRRCDECHARGWLRRTSVRYDEKEGFTTTSPYEVGGLYGEGAPLTLNVANEEHLLDQVILFLFFTMEHESYVVLQIHGGADVRGGYSDPRVFALGDHDDGAAMFDYARGAIVCTGEGPFVAKDVGQQVLPCLADSDDDHHEHYWATENGHRFERQEGCVIGGATPLDAYEKVSLDAEEHARLVSEGAELDERGVVETEGRHANLVARTWVRGTLCYAQEDVAFEDGRTIAGGTGFCPVCGGRLEGAAQ